MQSACVTSGLSFDVERGVGFEPFVEQPIYDEAYFNKYVIMGKSSFGVALNSLRVGLVSRYLNSTDSLTDIGVGDGAFIRARGGNTDGYDINPVAQRMLIDAERSRVMLRSIQSASFWDSLEHIEDCWSIVKKIKRYCFVSIPVFRDHEHIVNSKHYRPDEHCWYFTRYGLIRSFWDCDFACREMNDMETSLGREDIGTFVFEKVR